MKNSFLISSKCKVYGWMIFFIALGLNVFCYSIYPNLNEENISLEIKALEWRTDGSFDGGMKQNMQQEILSSLIIIGLLMISFSREKDEDEYITSIRLKSWQWAVLISYGILLIANLLIYGSNFLSFMLYNMLTVLVVFIAKFNYSMWMLRKERLEDEK
ncbi:MAG: hypothetical protein V4687_11190 [Bacteroidota bacterium]